MTKSSKKPCSDCGNYKRLTSSGVIALHHPNGDQNVEACGGSLRPPKATKPRATGWSTARRATLARDNGRCRKCLAPSDLDVHHKTERVYGGTDDLDNLITLCSNCHAEWTFCEPATLAFEKWLGLPPARFLVPMFAGDWPDDVPAREFKEHIINAFALLAYEHSNPRSP